MRTQIKVWRHGVATEAGRTEPTPEQIKNLLDSEKDHSKRGIGPDARKKIMAHAQYMQDQKQPLYFVTFTLPDIWVGVQDLKGNKSEPIEPIKKLGKNDLIALNICKSVTSAMTDVIREWKRKNNLAAYAAHKAECERLQKDYMSEIEYFSTHTVSNYVWVMELQKKRRNYPHIHIIADARINFAYFQKFWINRLNYWLAKHNTLKVWPLKKEYDHYIYQFNKKNPSGTPLTNNQFDQIMNRPKAPEFEMNKPFYYTIPCHSGNCINAQIVKTSASGYISKYITKELINNLAGDFRKWGRSQVPENELFTVVTFVERIGTEYLINEEVREGIVSELVKSGANVYENDYNTVFVVPAKNKQLFEPLKNSLF